MQVIFSSSVEQGSNIRRAPSFHWTVGSLGKRSDITNWSNFTNQKKQDNTDNTPAVFMAEWLSLEKKLAVILFHRKYTASLIFLAHVC